MRISRLARAAYRMRRGLPTFISFNITNRCTERCPMCSVWREPSDEMDVPEVRRVFSDLRRAGFAVVEVSGGEPLLRADLPDIMSVFDSLGFLYSVNTNGTLLTPETVDALSRHPGMLQLAVSLDSLQRERYAALRGADSLPAVLRGLDAVAASPRRIPAKLNVTVTRVNLGEIGSIIEFARERALGVSVFPVALGSGHAHRSEDPMFEATPQERSDMARLFRSLARMRRAGGPLWEYSGYYEVAADYVEGRPMAGCDAGRVFFDLRADGRLAACVDLPPFASLREVPVREALAGAAGELARIRACAEHSPCCYTCTANVSETARHPFAFVLEESRRRIAR